MKCQRFSVLVKDSFPNLYLSSEMCKILSELVLVLTTRSLRLPPLVQECTLTPGCAVREQRRGTLSVESELQKERPSLSYPQLVDVYTCRNLSTSSFCLQRIWTEEVYQPTNESAVQQE